MIHGYASFGNFSIYITVVAPDAQNISILSPHDGSIFKTESVLVSINATSTAGVDTIWFNVDNGSNTTFTTDVNFTVAEGSHIFYAFSNDTNGSLVNTSTSFTVNLSIPFDINFTTFDGATTNFTTLNRTEQQTISFAVVENSTFGRINFRETINVSRDIALDGNILFGNGSVVVDSPAIPEFNTSANITMYGLSLSDPAVLVNGVACTSEQCTEISYNSTTGTFVFNVTHFTNYSVEETTSSGGDSGGSSSSSSGGGGGGGGGGASIGSIRRLLEERENENRIVSLEVDVPGFIDIETDGVEVASVVLFNTGGATLDNITLLADSSSTAIDVRVGSLPVTSLEAGERTSARLEIRKNGEVPLGKHEIVISAHVGDPGFTQRARIIVEIKANEVAQTTQDSLSFANQLIQNNPSCAELRELLDRAQQELARKNYQQAKRLSEAAITGCQGILSKGSRGLELPGNVTPRMTLTLIIAGLILALLIASMVMKRSIQAQPRRQPVYTKKKKKPFLILLAVIFLVTAVGGLFFVLQDRGTELVASSGSAPVNSEVLQSLFSSAYLKWYIGLAALVLLLFALRKVLRKRPSKPRGGGSFDAELDRINKELGGF